MNWSEYDKNLVKRGNINEDIAERMIELLKEY